MRRGGPIAATLKIFGFTFANWRRFRLIPACMSRTYLLCLLIALAVMDGYVNDGRGARFLLRAGQSAGENFNIFVDGVVRQAFPRAHVAER